MNKLYPEFFRRLDERPDALFFGEPRRVKPLDDGALQVARELYGRLLPAGGAVLELLAGYHSPLPENLGKVVGVGLNATEMRENPHLDEIVMQDLNRNAELPFADGAFDGAVCTSGVQYLTRPDELFPEVARCLKPGAPFVVTFSNRMYPTKAILAWRASDDAAHVRLVESYFALTPAFGSTECFTHAPRDGGDPLYAVWARRREEARSN